MPEEELREQLSAAQAEYRQAVQEAAELEVAAERATARVAEAQAHLAPFVDLDQRLAHADAQKLKTGELLEPDEALERQVRDRRRAREQAARADAAHQHLLRELGQARDAANAANERLAVAVAAIAVADARKLATRLDELEAETLELRTRLASLQLIGGLELPADLARRPFAPLTSVQRNPVEVSDWLAFQKTLRLNSEAKCRSPER